MLRADLAVALQQGIHTQSDRLEFGSFNGMNTGCALRSDGRPQDIPFIPFHTGAFVVSSSFALLPGQVWGSVFVSLYAICLLFGFLFAVAYGASSRHHTWFSFLAFVFVDSSL